MRAPAVLLVALLAAGCAQSSAPIDDVEPPLGLEAFRACPVVRGQVHGCEPGEDSPYLVDVRSEAPPGWSCLTFADRRFATDVFGNGEYAFPDWYTYYGPVVADGGPTGAMGVGIKYDAHGDAPAVAGAVVIDTEDDERVFVWQGPADGFVQLPTPITGRDLRLYGVVHPVGPTQGLHDLENGTPPGFHWASQPALEPRTFWSLGAFDRSQGYTAMGGDALVQWNLVHNVEVAGQTLHLPAPRNGTVGLGPSDGSGIAHWGWTRGSPFNTSLLADGLQVEASLQPYVEFYAEYHDLQDPNGLATSRFLCGCPDPVIANWVADPSMGVQCLAGTPLPLLVQEDRTATRVSLR